MARFPSYATVRALGLVTLTALAVTLSADAVQTSRDEILKLAATGKVDEAWLMWGKLAPGPETLRLGVDIAAEAGQIERGLELYDELVGPSGPPDARLLRTLALGAAAGLSTSTDRDVRVIACGAALVMQPAHNACRAALERLVKQDGDAIGRALGFYALANAGLPRPPVGTSDAERGLTRETRLRVAQVFLRLPPTERLDLLRPLFEDADPVVVYQALLVAADVPGPEVLAALRSLQPPSAVRMGLTVALVRHGDRGSMDKAVEMLDGIAGYERVQIGRGLLESLDQRGLEILDEILKSPVDIDRISAAAALARINPASARQVLLESLTGGSAAVQSAALQAAGLVRMGADRAVYQRLADRDETVRSFAVEAMANSLVALPPQLLPASYQ